MTAACGCPEGLILGFADPGGTLERLDPYDAKFQTYLTFITGQGGGGKTVMVNALLCARSRRACAGSSSTARRSPPATAASASRATTTRCSPCVPGSAKVHVGSGGSDVISPWDVPDPAAVAGAKFEFLLAFHALLIGNLSDRERRLTADEEGPLTTAIAAVYARCATSGERPRETLLVDELRRSPTARPATATSPRRSTR